MLDDRIPERDRHLPHLSPAWPRTLNRAIFWMRIGGLVQLTIAIVCGTVAWHADELALRILFGFIAMVQCVSVVIDEWVIHAIRGRKSWGWIGGLCVAALESGSLLFPISAVVLIALLHPDSRAWFEAPSERPPV